MTTTEAQQQQATTPLTIDGRRHRLDRSADRHLGWLPYEAKLWDRRKACARCERLTRWAGLWWCGTPLVIRIVKASGLVAWMAADRLLALAGITAEPRDWSRYEPRITEGCGCCLNLKWNMIVHPRWRVRQAWRWLTGSGDADRRRPPVTSCPLDKWPSICVSE